MKIETFDLIQQRRAETATQAYQGMEPRGGNPHVLYDRTRRAEPLRGWDKVLMRTLGWADYNIQIPPDVEWDNPNAMYTDASAKIELSDGARSMSAFVLRNKPYDMSVPIHTTLVVSETGQPDESLVGEHPLLSVWAGPQGPYAAESPLLHDEANPTAWQEVVTEVLLVP